MSGPREGITEIGAAFAPAATFRKRSPAFVFNKLKRKFFLARMRAETQADAELIAQLRERILNLRQIDPDEATTVSERVWSKFRVDLRLALLANDPRRFLEFKVIKETMFVDDPPYIGVEYDYLRRLPDWRDRWRPALKESNRILVPRCPYYAKSSGSLIHYAFHVAQFERHTGISIHDVRSVLEFGGGFGGMCRVLHALGFRGRYYIFDLPEFSALQEFYLKINDLSVQSFGFDGAFGVTCFSDFAQFEELKRSSLPELFLATWSLSETSLDFRRNVLATLTARDILIAYQGEFETINNSKFFSDWTLKNLTHEWKLVPATHLPGSNFYLFGKQREVISARNSQP